MALIGFALFFGILLLGFIVFIIAAAYCKKREYIKRKNAQIVAAKEQMNNDSIVEDKWIPVIQQQLPPQNIPVNDVKTKDDKVDLYKRFKLLEMY